MSETPAPTDPDREDGLPRVIETDSSGEVKDVMHNKVRVRWSVTVRCQCGEDLTLSSLTSIVKCDECEKKWEAKSALG